MLEIFVCVCVCSGSLLCRYINPLEFHVLARDKKRVGNMYGHLPGGGRSASPCPHRVAGLRRMIERIVDLEE